MLRISDYECRIDPRATDNHNDDIIISRGQNESERQRTNNNIRRAIDMSASNPRAAMEFFMNNLR